MARIVVGSWMVRYPLGGILSWTLQWLVGFQRLGHEVWLVEKSGYPDSCFDPVRRVMSDDCTYGLEVVAALLRRFGLEDNLCYVDAEETYHGLSRRSVESVFRSADLFVDLGTHGAWLEEAQGTTHRVLVDGEPGSTQMKWEKRRAEGQPPPRYDYYYTNGATLGTAESTAPTVGLSWRPVFNPVVVDLFTAGPAEDDAAFTTVMNWQAHEPLVFQGTTYGQKDVEFQKFLDLPQRVRAPLEVAAAGKVPREQLIQHGWRCRNAHEVTVSFDSYRSYIAASRGEFSVCKNVYVATGTGWFSDRSAAYLASARPVVLQETGFSTCLPSGRGVFAVNTMDEAAAAIDEIQGDYRRQSAWAHEVAREHLEARVVLRKFLQELGLD